jgi:hypothetical protein
VKPTITIKNGVFTYSGIMINSFGIGTRIKKDELTFLFEDNTKVSLLSWNKFNCKGASYFDLNASELSNLNKNQGY